MAARNSTRRSTPPPREVAIGRAAAGAGIGVAATSVLDVQAADIAWVAHGGAEIRAQAAALLPVLGPLATVTRLRAEHPDVAADLISAACSVAATTGAHAAKLGPRWGTLLLTDTLAQQATDSRVAAYRARAARERGISRIIDASAGSGMDSLAFADAGLLVTAIERDAIAFACLQANLHDGRAIHADALDVLPDLIAESPTAVFVDPARRDPAGPRRADGARANAERDPERWSPPWSWVRELALHTPVVAKVAPGIPRSLLRGTSTEWIGNGSELVEACVWFGGLRAEFTRRATVLGTDDTIDSIDDLSNAARPIIPLGDWLIEPHDAVIRADLVDVLATRHRLGGVAESSTWLTGNAPIATPLARNWRVDAVVPMREVRAAITGYARAVFKTSDVDRSAESVAASVGHRPVKDASGTIVVVMMRGLDTAALVRPAQM